METAKLPRLLGAIFYDTIIVFTIIFIAAQWFPLIPEAMQTLLWMKIFKQIYVLSLCFIYFAYSWQRGGQTIGMKSWRLQIIQNNGSNNKLSWSQCFVRYTVAILSWLPFSLGFIWTHLNKQNLSWHDKASKTRLIVIPKK